MNNQKKNLSSEIWKMFINGFTKIEKRHIKELAKYKLTIPQFNVLEVLLNFGSLPLKKISNELNVTGANITCVVDNLEKRELAVRVPSTSDRRIINAKLTEKGRELILSIIPKYFDVIEDVTENLEENEKEEFKRLLKKLVA